MSSQLRFFGVAAYELVNPLGQHILMDPFLDENPGSPIKSRQLERVDLIIVSHAAPDHLGDTEAIARRTGAPIICGGEVKAFLTGKGLPPEQIRATTWGISVEVAGIKVQPVECHHWSQITLPNGAYASGLPFAFVVYAEPGIRFYHYGDTAIFSDLKLQGELYQPTIGCVGIANPEEILHRFKMPGRMLTAEMSPREGALAAEWLGLDTVLPCHFINPDCPEVREFQDHLVSAEKAGRKIPQMIVMRPGEWITLEPNPREANH
jgi:L-ascorbate metabolism protein UlaG (beta-lactamase superfamily)